VTHGSPCCAAAALPCRGPSRAEKPNYVSAGEPCTCCSAPSRPCPLQPPGRSSAGVLDLARSWRRGVHY
jgi:hypothetical protein